jgi:hypothetical protein
MATWLVDRDWRAELLDARRLDNEALRIVCPFIKATVIRDLLGATPPRRLDVVTRFDLADFASGVSDVAALRAILAVGGRVRGIRGLHAKVFIFGDRRAAVTSANLTSRGLTTSHEFGCISEDAAFVRACSDYFVALWELGAVDVATTQLDEWDLEVRAFLLAGGHASDAVRLPDHGAVSDLTVPVPPAEGWVAESTQAFIKFFGEGHNRLPWRADVLDEVRRSGCHWAATYPAGRRPRQVADGDTIYLGRLVEAPNDTVIFGRAVGLRYVPGRDDAIQPEIAERPWRARWPHYVRLHHAEFVAGELGNGVRMNELMRELDAEAFASTARNRRLGQGNQNPRAAVRRKPAVKLTAAGAAWVAERLQRALAVHGSVPADELAKLDWPSGH